ncbi:alpha-(1,3)-fucosyltransferase C-like [Anticarsia gemmatalis]|uniref:alpha-(1,3)-fucosyltransferase C-like n=1 Tax=Anticarsia gemmatalis TaxID=129554 RepID=UPI003F75B1DA
MRALFTKKVTFVIIVLFVFVILYNKLVKTPPKQIIYRQIDSNGVKTLVSTEVVKDVKNEQSDLKYILQWTPRTSVPFAYMGVGQQGFIERKCPFTNCIVTDKRTYLDDLTKFDVIAFAGPQVVHPFFYNKHLPDKRSPHQKYVFASIESADNYPICSNVFDNYFNWTWTFRLDSEVRWGYMTIRDSNNSIVGPKKDMNWIRLEDMDPVSEEFKEQLRSKTRAAAWFVSNCYTKSKRELVIPKLREALKKYGLEIDVYGKCGNLKCSRDNEEECDKLIKEVYYFYLSFENSFSEDYVTEKLLHAVENDAIPIVYGGADYTRFLPNGTYLNARELSMEELAKKMNELIKDPEKYAEYFKWKNHYSYYRKHVSVETDPYCLFCTTLNDEEMVKKTTIYKDFRKWWDPPNRC